MVYKHIVVFLLSRCDRTTVALVVHKCCSLLCLACPHMWSSLQPDLFGTLTCPLPASCWAASWECLEFLQEVSYKYASCDGRRVILRQFSSAETSWSPKGGERQIVRQVADAVLCFYNSVELTLTQSLSSIIKKKLKVNQEFQPGIEPGSSKWKARLITIRPRWLDDEKQSFDLFKLHTFNS